MATTEERVIACCKQIISYNDIGLDVDQIHAGSELVEDLDLDSLDLFEILMAIEEEFGCPIPDGKLPACKTVADVVALVQRTIGEVTA